MTQRRPLLPRLSRVLRRLGMSEAGTASVEFVIIVPVFLAIFMSAFESGLLTLRHAMLERAVDISVRNLRLGLWANPTPELLRDSICQQAVDMAT
jgi:Flp pilus assembly protein TadG